MNQPEPQPEPQPQPQPQPQQPNWDSKAAAAYYNYATKQTANTQHTNPDAYAQYASYGLHLWANLNPQQKSYYLAIAKKSMPTNSPMDQMTYAQHVAVSAIYPHYNQFYSTSSPLSSIHPLPNFTSVPLTVPKNSNSDSTAPNKSLPWRLKNTLGGPAGGEIYDPEKRKSIVGAFSKTALAILQKYPKETRDWIKRERLTPKLKAFVDGISLAPLPDPIAFVTSSISEYNKSLPHSQTNKKPTPQLSNVTELSSISTISNPVSSTPPDALKTDQLDLYVTPAKSISKMAKTPGSTKKKKSPPVKNHASHNGTTSNMRPSCATYTNKSNTPPSNDKPSWVPKEKPSVIMTNGDNNDPELSSKKSEREQRFKQHAQRLASERAASIAMARVNLSHYQEVHRLARTASGEMNNADSDSLDDVVVGTCQVLERPFLRLTSAPNPAQVRPLPILYKCVHLLMTKWRAKHDYQYMCDQLKSVRQDLLVQRIQNQFTVTVYEMHARIALEMQDFSEFNQCQTQLKILYDKGVSGCHSEFLSYRILYFLYTKSRRDMKILLASLTLVDLTSPYVNHALAIRQAVQRADFIEFFRIYQRSDLLMGKYILSPMLDRERVKGLWVLTKSHNYVPMKRIVEALGWGSAGDAILLINSLVDQVCNACLITPVPTDRSTIYVSDIDIDINGRMLRAITEAWLLSFTQVDIKGQLD